MYSGKYVFAQLLSFVDKYEFNKCVKRYFGNYRVHGLDCWNQFIQLLYGQITSLESLRSICVCMKAHKGNLYHLGIKQHVVHTTLSRANERRDWQIFADFGNYLIKLVRPLYADSPIPTIDLKNEIFALDSTSISVSINLFTWAEGKPYRQKTLGTQRKCCQNTLVDGNLLISDSCIHQTYAQKQTVNL